MGKYTPLEEHLRNYFSKDEDELVLSFSDIEEIIGDSLPKSAFTHRSFWANNETKAWVKASCNAYPNLKNQEVTMRRELPIVIDYPREREDFERRWNIEPISYPDYSRFKIRLLNAASGFFAAPDIRRSLFEKKFCLIIGISYQREIRRYDKGIIGNYIRDQKIEDFQSLINLIWVLEIVFSMLTEEGEKGRINQLYRILKVALDLSPNINVDIIHNGQQYIFVPKGAKVLDTRIINENLVWLSKFPTSQECLEKALRLFLEKDESKTPEILDNLRKSLEFLIRSLLNNKRSLENNKPLIGGWLKDKGISKEIRNLYTSLLDHYIKYQNEHVKHGSTANLNELEYMIYQTGTFMRLLQTLSEGIE